jgi:hypothetical protein
MKCSALKAELIEFLLIIFMFVLVITLNSYLLKMVPCNLDPHTTYSWNNFTELDYN